MPTPAETGLQSQIPDVIAGAQWAQAQPAPVPAPTATPAPASPAGAPRATPAQAPAQNPTQDPASEPIGNVATLTGTATVTRNKVVTPLALKDDIFQDDVLQTSANSTLGVTFNDATTFNLTANAQIAIDSFVYQDGGQQNGALFNIEKGTVAFVAAAVAKTGDMRISTPTATLGIRGTTGLVEVPQGASATGSNNVAIKLYPDPDGRVGHIDVTGHDGTRLGSLTEGASGFTIRPGAGGRFTAERLTITPQQALRDRGIVRQVHAAQAVGRQIVTERRSSQRNNPAANPARPGPQRRNNLQQPPGSPQPLGQPNRQGQPQQPLRQPAQPAGQPGAQPAELQRRSNAPGVPGAPSVQGAPGVPGSSVVQGAPRVPGSPAVQGAPAAAPPPGVQRPGLQQPGVTQPGLPKPLLQRPIKPPPVKPPPKEKKKP